MTRKRSSAKPPAIVAAGTDNAPVVAAKRDRIEGDAFPIVAIGASAGGVEAFMELFDMLPDRCGMAFVLIQHLDPTHESTLPEILSQHTGMIVSEAADRTALEPDHVYVIPRHAYLTVKDGMLRVSIEREKHGARFPIDRFLTSLAEENRARTVAVILTGTGTDGSLGLKAINEHAGLIIAQDPDEAAFDGMPRNAIGTGAVDLVLPLVKIAEALLQQCAHARTTAPGETDAGVGPDTILAQILALVHQKTSRDFGAYKEASLLRRIQRRMAIRGSETLDEYLKLLRADPSEIALLAKDMLIHVTQFFRGTKDFETLASSVIPDLVRQHRDDVPLRIWVTACSTGEEAYSIAILFFEEMARRGRNINLQIFATDIDEEMISIARQGVYSPSIKSEIDPERLEHFFIKETDGYRASTRLRETIVFTAHDILKDAPFSRIDFISCRNLLIYLRPEAQDKIIGLFHFSLRQDGVLFLGASETPGDPSDLFKPISHAHHLYRRVGQGRASQLQFPIDTLERTRVTWPNVDRASERRLENLGNITHRILADAYAPASVLINAKHESLYHFGPIDRYLRVSPGEFSRDLFTMARDGLGLKLRIAVRQARQRHEAVTATGAEIRRDGKTFFATATVRPLDVEGQELLLVSFFDEPGHKAKVRRSPRSLSDAARIAELENDVATTRQELEQTIRELEHANEELRANNEEAMSVNEEFHATSEELQTSKEELQSLNEELTTVNGQLQIALEKQRSTASDLQNILNSTDIATLFLDRDFNIRFFTPSAKTLFGIIDTDVGRPLANLALPRTDATLLDDAGLVLRDLSPVQREIKAENDAWYIRRILPIRTQDDQVAGIIITFSDVSQMKVVEEQIRDARNYAVSIIDTIREPLVVLDGSMGIVSANTSFYRYFAATAEDTLGRTLGQSGAGELGVPGLDRFIDEIRAGKIAQDHEIEIERKGRGRRVLMLRAREIENRPADERRVLVAIDDITERVEAEQALVDARKAAEEANFEKSRFLAAASHDLRQPLQTLRLLRGIIEQKVVDPETVQLMKRAGETLDGLNGLLDSMLDNNQLEAGTILPQVDAFPIHDLLDRLRSEFAVHAEAAGVAWRVIPSKRLVKSDQHLLERMLRNLLSNAFKYTRRGKILLGCRAHGDRLSIEVWDTGAGIPEGDLPTIFNEFHRTGGMATPDPNPGLGLGLSIVRRLGELLDHPIDVCSRVGKGSAFKIKVPIGTDRSADHRTMELRADGGMIPSRKGRILVIEDDAPVREMLGMFLSGVGHHVVLAADGQEALDAVYKVAEAPDLLIADYSLPDGADGFAAIDNIRKALNAKLPAIVLTGDISTVTLQAITRRGEFHLAKPVTGDRLAGMVARLLAASPQSPAAPERISASSDLRVFVVDDDRGIRDTLRELLEIKGYQVETYSDGESLLKADSPGMQGCLILDANMPGMGGLEVLEHLKGRDSRLSICMITGKGDIATAVTAMKAGAIDFIEKPVDPAQLIATINRAFERARIASEESESRASATQALASMTKRQRQVLDLILAGKVNKEIAASLRINQRTVESHRALIMKKMGATSVAELVRLVLTAH
ncbi:MULTISPECIES: chemotaxis protein CheB [Sphingomonadaceae]|uniref:chemotaxis protein CheB n=1 Tax=Sphingomonadales TaxID=204457 RepID=UPI0009E9107A|nr:chemotaxis protein CheB [Sphingobium sp. TKS]MCF8706750.1 response regulator [Rhizorhapis sp. SPR117]